MQGHHRWPRDLTSRWAPRPAVLQEELCSCEQPRAAPRATRSRPLVSPPCVGCAQVQSGPGSTPLFHDVPPPSTPRGLRVQWCVSARGKGRRNFPRTERPPAQSVEAACMECLLIVLPSQKPGTSLSAALPDPPRSCRSDAPACKRAAVPSPSGPSRLQTGGRHVSWRGGARSVAEEPTGTSPRQSSHPRVS